MWTRYQEHFLSASGRAINFDYRLKFIVIQSFGTTMAVVIPIAQTVMLASFTIEETIGFYHQLALHTVFAVWWSLQCNAFVCAVRSLRENMKRELADDPTRVDIKRYRKLWVGIHAMMEKFSSSVYYLYGLYNAANYLCLFVSGYCAVSLFLSMSSHRTVLTPKFLGFIVCIVYYGTHYYGFINSADRMIEEFTHAVRNDLLELQPYKLSKDNAREVLVFIDTIYVKKVALVVGGNFTIERRTLSDFISSMAMWWLVLLQIKITLPRNDD